MESNWQRSVLNEGFDAGAMTGDCSTSQSCPAAFYYVAARLGGAENSIQARLECEKNARFPIFTGAAAMMMWP